MSIHMRVCEHCGVPYDWRRSPSTSLKMTYCGSLCERANLGFTIDTLIGEVQIVRSAWRDLLAA
ncbi:MAG TPA: hypothetical protein PKD27_09865 [Tepidiformaceae bacterium]|nr:hypothetical protein [Tepidiformaceae bacterium]